MKTRILSLLLAATCFAGYSQANETAPTVAASVVTTNKPLQEILQGLKDGYDQLKDVSFADGLSGGIFGIYHDGDYGGGAFVSTAHTNGLNLGFSIATIQENNKWEFYDAALSVSANGTFEIPVIGRLDVFAETGIATDLANPQTVYSQSLSGASKTFVLSKSLALSVGGGVGYLSKWTTPFYLASVSLIYKPKGW